MQRGKFRKKSRGQLKKVIDLDNRKSAKNLLIKKDEFTN